MKPPLQFAGIALVLAILFAFITTPCPAAATLTQQIDPHEVKVGDPVIVTLTVQGGTIGTIQLPTVDGLQVGETNYQIKSGDDNNGNTFTSVTFNIPISPIRPGDFTIPAFDLHTQEGDVLHVVAREDDLDRIAAAFARGGER